MIGRLNRYDIPIIFVTSRDSTADELYALSLGGDDYITKPYNIPVLLARIKAVLRRSGRTSEPDILAVGSLTLHLTQGTVSAGEKSVELTRNELKILSCLMTHAGKIVSRARLDELETIMTGLDKKYLFAECIPKAQNTYERKQLELFKKA